MSFTIVNVENKVVEACAMFNYRGFTISASTIFGQKRPSVCVFKDGAEKYVFTVEEAIEYVDAQQTNADTITMPRKEFGVMRDALMTANRVINERGMRFNALDQNPLGIRDQVGMGFSTAQRLTK